MIRRYPDSVLKAIYKYLLGDAKAFQWGTWEFNRRIVVKAEMLGRGFLETKTKP